ncbi:MAG: hypothetical protein WC697_02140 [Patescibacteria group bacterium]|jgi:hypothetical protein
MVKSKISVPEDRKEARKNFLNNLVKELDAAVNSPNFKREVKKFGKQFVPSVEDLQRPFTI